MSFQSINIPARKLHVFASVFGTIDDTRSLSKSLSKNSSATKNSRNQSYQAEWDASWHLVTKALCLPSLDGNHGRSSRPAKGEERTIDPRFQQALQVLLSPVTLDQRTSKTLDIITWYSLQVRQHFLNQVLPVIRQLQRSQGPEPTLLQSIEILETSYSRYHDGLSIITTQMEARVPGSALPLPARFRRDLNAVVNNTVMDILIEPLAIVMKRQVSITLGLSLTESSNADVIRHECRESEKARRTILRLVNALKQLGLAGERFQVTFAETMNDAISEYINGGCQSTFSPTTTTSNSIGTHANEKSYPSQCVKEIYAWVSHRYTELVTQVLGSLDDQHHVSWAEREKFKEISLSRLVELRIRELFEIVENWPLGGRALDDLRTAVTTPQRRLQLTEEFSRVLASKVLHPAASTTRILQTYVHMISSFHALDNSKVLLDRVAYPLQLYLSSREDTVRIVINNLLADPDETEGSEIGERLTELAQLLNDNNESESAESRSDDEELNWNDMDWLPDPVDAGPGYKRSKNADVIGTLVGVLGSQEVFIKEFQNIIGENFLKNDGMFTKEIKVLEMLKVRFGEAPLQACEVMLKDIQESEKVDFTIRRKQKLSPSKQGILTAQKIALEPEGKVDSEGLLKPSLHSKILSRLFWPQLNAETYRVPTEVAELQRKYEEGFEELKSARKLSWLHTLGQATIELELEDRNFVAKVHTWQAAVIWAFRKNDANDTDKNFTIQQLSTDLEMDDTLVRSAVRFWVKKCVLYEVSPDTYAVLETMSQEDRARSDTKTTQYAAPGEREEIMDDAIPETLSGIVNDKMGIYWQFILGMLTNSSSQMPLSQIGMMLRMLIIDGFPYTDEELREFLAQKVVDGELVLTGGKYQLKK